MMEETRTILSRVIAIRDDLEAGRLTIEQARLYDELGRQVEALSRNLGCLGDNDAAAVILSGVELISDYLAEHFPIPTKH